MPESIHIIGLDVHSLEKWREVAGEYEEKEKSLLGELEDVRQRLRELWQAQSFVSIPGTEGRSRAMKEAKAK